MELFYSIIPIALGLIVLVAWDSIKEKQNLKVRSKSDKIPPEPPKQLQVLGKVRKIDYPKDYDWVLGYDSPTIVGSSTVYHFIGGGRCGTRLEELCYDTMNQAEQLEAAGKKFKIFNWNELLSSKG